MACYLGFDFGQKRVGVAVGDSETGTAHPLQIIQEQAVDPLFQAIAALIHEWRPVGLVVGLPCHLDGTPHEMTRLATKFANRLHGRFGLPVCTVDECLTSVEAGDRLQQAGMRGRQQRSVLDAVAAQLILQVHLDDLRRAPD